MKKTFTVKPQNSLLHIDQEKEPELSVQGPDDFLIRSIMNYSMALVVLKTTHSGKMRIILN